MSPIAVVTMAEPSPVVTDTLMPPIMLQTMMYHSMLFLPYLPDGAGRGIGSARVLRCGMRVTNSLGREVKDDDECCNNEDAAVHKEAGAEE